MTVQFTGRTSGCVYSGIVIDTTGTITNLPTSMVPDAYDVATTHTSTTYVCIPGYTGTATCSLSGTTFALNSDGSDSIDGNISCSGNLYPVSAKGSSLPVTIGPGEIGGSGGAVATPELESDQLLAAGLVPTLGLLLYRRRRRGPSKASDTPDDVVH